jgi:hypothetical protein
MFKKRAGPSAKLARGDGPARGHLVGGADLVNVCPEMALSPDLGVMLKKIMLGISHICLRLFFSQSLISNEMTYF